MGQATIIMDKCDTNDDGKLNFEEFSHVHASMQLSSDEKLIHTCFSVMDENGDGTIELEEFQMAMSGGFESGNIARSRLTAGIGGGAEMAKNIQLDIDADGKRSSFSKGTSSRRSSEKSHLFQSPVNDNSIVPAVY